jgi:hypothetical protein
MLWAGCVLTTIATEYVFEVRTYAIFSINAGFWLIGMMLREPSSAPGKRNKRAPECLRQRTRLPHSGFDRLGMGRKRSREGRRARAPQAGDVLRPCSDVPRPCF